MNKNSILAVVLSGLVLAAYMFVQTKFFTPQPTENVNQTTEVAENSVEQNQNDLIENSINAEFSEIDSSNEVLPEENYVIETNKVRVVFTNRGGDIKSFELIEHKDAKTQKYVQMAENVTDSNRAFSLSLGNQKNKIINDLFFVKEFPVDQKGQKKIAFFKKYENYTLVKQFTFMPDEYMFKMDVIFDGDEGFSGLSFNGDVSANNQGNTKFAYYLNSSPQIGPFYNPKTDRYENRNFMGHNGSKVKRILLSENQNKKYDKDFIWAGIGGKYFCELIIPENSMNIKNAIYSTPKTNFSMANAQFALERGEFSENRVTDSYYVYMGPRSEKELRKYASASNNEWKFQGKKITDALQTSGFLGWLETIFKWTIQFIYKLIPNWGVSIIIMTILLKIVLFPLTLKSLVGTKKMQEIQPKMQEIQAKYKENPQKLQQETAKLYQQVGYNPMSGCLPMIFQMMALFAMYNLFNNYFEFRGAGFVKGWIDDLSVGDSVWSWNKNIFLISGFTGNHLRILPIIYLFSQLFYGKITQMGGTGVGGQSAGTMKFMTYGLPIIFSFMFYNAPSGLLLFWTVSNIIQMLQQIIINKVIKDSPTSKNSKSIKSAKNIKDSKTKSNVIKFPGKGNRK